LKPTAQSEEAVVARGVAEGAHSLSGTAEDFDPALELIGDVRFVLIGE
jgi:hypothetical protein